MSQLGVDHTLHLTRERFYWPRMQRDIKHHIRHACHSVKQKTPTLKIRAPLKPITTTSPFEVTAIDLFFIWRRVLEGTSISLLWWIILHAMPRPTPRQISQLRQFPKTSQWFYGTFSYNPFSPSRKRFNRTFLWDALHLARNLEITLGRTLEPCGTCL